MHSLRKGKEMAITGNGSGSGLPVSRLTGTFSDSTDPDSGIICSPCLNQMKAYGLAGRS